MNLPAHLGPYRIVSRIGCGGMAEVFRARRHGASGFEKVVALKVLLPEFSNDADLQRLLIAEAKLGAAMAHRNLVTVFDLGVDAGRYYVAMELVEGDDLHALRGDDPMPLDIALHVAAELGHALTYIHAFSDDNDRPLGLVHRDISPGNVLLSRSGEVKLADFGIAKATELAAQTHARIVRGKFAYLSPEQLAGKPLTARTDQFALGVTIAEFVTGVRPFDAPTAVETMDRIRAGAPDLSPLPEQLRRIVARCLAQDPADRFEGVQDVVAKLQVLQREAPASGPTQLGGWVRAQLA